MRRTETRPFPVNRTALIRCAFLALAKIGAKLHSYDEQTGMLTATIAWRHIGSLDVFERIIEIRVQEYDGTSVLKLVAPQEQSDVLLRLISTYAVEGAQAIEEDAHMQWAGLIKKEEGRRETRARAQAWIDKLTHLVQQIPLVGRTADEATAQADVAPAEITAVDSVAEYLPATSPQAFETESKAIVPLEPRKLELAVPPSPGMLIADRRGRVYEIQVDARTTADRRRHLVVCPDPACSATNLLGSSFCFRCGKQLTLGAASEEVTRRVLSNAASSLRYGALSLLPVTLLIVIGAVELILAGGAISATAILSALTGSASSVTSELTRGLVATTIPILIFAALPSFLLGRLAIARADRALSDLSFNFLADKAGRKRATLGRLLGSVGMYAGISVFALVLLSGYIAR